MSDRPRGPEGSNVRQIRVYYDPQTGEVVHIHSLLTPPGEPITEDQIQEEMAVFEQSLSERHPIQLQHLEVEEADLQRVSEPGVTLTVDLNSKQLVASPSP